MAEALDANKIDAEKDKFALAKIEPTKTETNPANEEELFSDFKIETENSLIQAIRHLLREHGIRKSGAAIRDSIEISHEHVGPREAVSALANLGFKASFGRLNMNKVSEDFFPLIGLKKMEKLFSLSLHRLMIRFP